MPTSTSRPTSPARAATPPSHEQLMLRILAAEEAQARRDEEFAALRRQNDALREELADRRPPALEGRPPQRPRRDEEEDTGVVQVRLDELGLAPVAGHATTWTEPRRGKREGETTTNKGMADYLVCLVLNGPNRATFRNVLKKADCLRLATAVFRGGDVLQFGIEPMYPASLLHGMEPTAAAASVFLGDMARICRPVPAVTTPQGDGTAAAGTPMDSWTTGARQKVLELAMFGSTAAQAARRYRWFAAFTRITTLLDLMWQHARMGAEAAVNVDQRCTAMNATARTLVLEAAETIRSAGRMKALERQMRVEPAEPMSASLLDLGSTDPAWIAAVTPMVEQARNVITHDKACVDTARRMFAEQAGVGPLASAPLTELRTEDADLILDAIRSKPFRKAQPPPVPGADAGKAADPPSKTKPTNDDGDKEGGKKVKKQRGCSWSESKDREMFGLAKLQGDEEDAYEWPIAKTKTEAATVVRAFVGRFASGVVPVGRQVPDAVCAAMRSISGRDRPGDAVPLAFTMRGQRDGKERTGYRWGPEAAGDAS